MSSNDQTTGRNWPLPLAVAVLALIAVVATLDSSGAVPQLGEGPGLTLDETFNVQMGVYQVSALREYGLALFHPDSVQEVFGDPAYNPDHPPLGRLLIGLSHQLASTRLDPDVAAGSVCVSCGRLASACGFALTVFLVGGMTSRWYGRGAGVIAAVSMLLMPRLFAHAHLASLETFVNLTYVATVLWVAARWNGDRPPPWRDIAVGGLLFGLCLLTKIQAVLLPIPIGLWVLWRWRLRAVLPMLVFGLIGLAVFFAGWPWLWLDPLAHVTEYFGRATDRQTLYCWYLGYKWADADVPWHYPFMMFAVTVPIGLHLLGVAGVIGRLFDRTTDETELFHEQQTLAHRRSVLIGLNVVWPLVFFALPGITVYDGTRLFLMVFPFWAIMIGSGGMVLLRWVSNRLPVIAARGLVGALLIAQAYGLFVMHPLQLSYYNLAAGAAAGAEQLGFEATYWGDSLTRSFLSEVASQLPAGSVLDVAPVLHPFQLQELISQSPALRQREIILRAYDDQSGHEIRYVMVFRRKADSWAALTPQPDGELLTDVRRGGVQLAALYELR